MKSRSKPNRKASKSLKRKSNMPLGTWLIRTADEITRDVPLEAWQTLPNDLSKNVDHYLYGTPKQDK